ncbi:MAG: hypothetical protein J5494_09555, partial [Candidatus Methanomethylophilaceae archaeon]|nr:hypothetical protein [Candidatus Methanomethylophilaceae archaeon]
KGETSVTGHPVQMGAYIKNVVKDSPASAAGLEPGTFVYSIEIGGAETKITSVKSFYDFMQSAAPGSSAVIRTVAPGSATADAHDMTVLDDSGGTAFLGITVTSGGFTVITPDALMSRASSPFYGADGSPMSYVTSLFSYLSGPINGMTPVSDEVKWWYDVPMGDIAWIVLTMLYWIFWLDILLAISNALPSRPFDGGLLFAGWIDWVLEKTGMGDGEKRRETGEKISSAMSNVVLLIFLMVIITMII